MTKKVAIVAGTITIAVALVGCVWVPLLISRLNAVNQDLEAAGGRITELDNAVSIEKSQAKKNQASLENQRDQSDQALKNTKEELDRVKLERAAIASQLDALQQLVDQRQKQAATVAASETTAKSSAKPPVNPAENSTDRKESSLSSAAKPVITPRFDEDELYDDSGWRSLREPFRP